MTMDLSIFAALTIGFLHAFEIDHIAAVSNLTTTNKNFKQTMKDGALWGLGHTSSIFVFGILMLLLKIQIEENLFTKFEAIVGVMLVCLGVWRIVDSYSQFRNRVQDSHQLNHVHKKGFLAYFIGLVHGLAGSGALIMLVLAQSYSTIDGMLYLLLFGVGSILGMLVASSILSYPMFRLFIKYKYLPMVLASLSALLCIAVGYKLTIENLVS